MKILFFVFIILSSKLFGQSDFYDLEVSGADNSKIRFNDFKGRKTCVAAVSLDKLEKGGFAFLDSLQSAFPTLKVIIVPAQDFKGERDAEISKSLKMRQQKAAFVAAPSRVTKKSDEQNALLRWLTHSDENTHFDIDVTSAFQVYVINESGVLFAVLEDGFSPDLLNEVLKSGHNVKEDSIKQ